MTMKRLNYQQLSKNSPCLCFSDKERRNRQQIFTNLPRKRAFFNNTLKKFLIALSIGLFFALNSIVFAQVDGLLPECRYDDIPAKYTDSKDWQISLLDTIYKLDENYAPSDLVNLSTIGFDKRFSLRDFVIDDLVKLLKAAKEAGNPLGIQSSYRSYAYQKSTFNYWQEKLGQAEALLTSARAGHSEHQLGTTVDFKSLTGLAPWDYNDWATTPTGAWLKENAHKYGFVMSYPKGKKELSCYSYEPWHYRYIGIEYATTVYESQLTLREWLWSLADYLHQE